MSNNPKCPVFGCTIPRGIPHEHPAGVSAVMRDPVAPLSADERAELERYRAAAETDIGEDAKRLRDALINQARGMQNVGPGSQVYDLAMGTNYYVVPADAPMVPSRKLRDALLMAGIDDADAGRTKPLSEVKERYAENKATASIVVNELSDAALDELLAKKRSEFGLTVSDWTEVRRLSVVQIAGRIATGIVIAVGAASVVILMAMSAGWL